MSNLLQMIFLALVFLMLLKFLMMAAFVVAFVAAIYIMLKLCSML